MRYAICLAALLFGTVSISSAQQKIFLEENGRILIEVEAIDLVSPWQVWTENHADNEDYIGDGYVCAADDPDQGQSGGSPTGLLRYPIKVSQDMTMKFMIRGMNGPAAIGCEEGDWCNDLHCWMENYPGTWGSPGKTMIKTAQWNWAGNREHGSPRIGTFDLKAGQVYTFVVACRSKLAMIDRIAFFTGSRKDNKEPGGALDITQPNTPIEMNGSVHTAEEVRRMERTRIHPGFLVKKNAPTGYYLANGTKVHNPASSLVGKGVIIKVLGESTPSRMLNLDAE